MPKARTVDRFFWDDPEVGMKLSRDERLLMIGCWTKLADDEGRFLADAAYVKKELFGYDDLPASEISGMLQKISEIFKTWIVYGVGAHQYVQIDPQHWQHYQEIRYVVRSRLPGPVGTIQTIDNLATSENFGKVQKVSENFPRARAVGLGSVGLSRELQCSNGNEQFTLEPVTANGDSESHGHTLWKKQLFDQQFWPTRWRNDGKASALEYFEKKVKTREQAAVIVKAAKAQKHQYESRELSKRPYMITWLNQQRYIDDPEPIAAQSSTADDYPELNHNWKHSS